MRICPSLSSVVTSHEIELNFVFRQGFWNFRRGAYYHYQKYSIPESLPITRLTDLNTNNPPKITTNIFMLLSQKCQRTIQKWPLSNYFSKISKMYYFCFKFPKSPQFSITTILAKISLCRFYNLSCPTIRDADFLQNPCFPIWHNANDRRCQTNKSSGHVVVILWQFVK